MRTLLLERGVLREKDPGYHEDRSEDDPLYRVLMKPDEEFMGADEELTTTIDKLLLDGLELLDKTLGDDFTKDKFIHSNLRQNLFEYGSVKHTYGRTIKQVVFLSMMALEFPIQQVFQTLSAKDKVVLERLNWVCYRLRCEHLPYLFSRVGYTRKTVSQYNITNVINELMKVIISDYVEGAGKQIPQNHDHKSNLNIKPAWMDPLPKRE